ncbi:unnamed protein product (macronuclear) [Paramecium tetraurelia]|uniref:non-specific serine/threonine protein kinase n=1 Tax=Paramecium tetraurelia TaxID=5888 RepID=A0DF69_PARTE|nr:uncharacterized protein GSPATT00016499001 [Paramecium tetraurelia]CAK81686.1 unnamed protein product [Paramecium tetraurelia]|eukprot:XP_001449083.1 hypothetical protein (macronuclear) [Paramecium tetraurelia strain d4-2]
MGICSSKKQKDDLALKLKHWPSSPGRRHTGNSFKYGTDLYINLKNGQIENFYTFGDVLGVGAFGQVMKATQKQSGQVRALKTLAKKKIINEEKEKMFAEVNILRKLDHPNIVRLFELFEDAKNYYLIIELIQGGSLIQKIQAQKTFSEAEAAYYMRQLISALQYCHKAKIVHRDLKLENLMLNIVSEKPVLKVIDFGTSRKIIQEKYLTSKLGTPHYTAPEVFKQQYTEKCDIWSCGVILYTLLCGYLPFNGSDARQTQLLIEYDKWSFDKNDWAQISPEAKKFVKKLMTYNPDKRISAEEAYLDPWLQEHINNTIDSKALNSLQKFDQSNVIQELIQQYITFQVLTPEDKIKILGNFQSLDKDGDGRINREDLIFGLKELKLDEIQIEKQIDKIMEQCDFNKTGSIEYNAFLSIMIRQELSEKTNKLEQAFKQFDLDNDGFVKKENLEDVFGGIIIDQTHWEEVLKKCDSDQQGIINKENFVRLLQQF